MSSSPPFSLHFSKELVEWLGFLLDLYNLLSDIENMGVIVLFAESIF
jgi:hypothetical protein